VNGATTAVTRAEMMWWGAIGVSVLAASARGVDRWAWTVAVCGGLVGLFVPLRLRPGDGLARWLPPTLLGAAAFQLTRSLWSVAVPGGRWAVAAGVGVGVAEEALFRRGLYGLVERWGGLVAVLSTSLVFGLVHVPVYGWSMLPIDIAAGVVFGWQRWATRSWTAPAVTHALANAVQYL
jgi:membrane protease YdiL (CAAX protease family)